MRAMILCLAFALTAGTALPGQVTTGDGLLHLVQDNGSGTINSESNKPAPPPGMRPQRFYCVIDPPASAETDDKWSCPARPGRVGGRCRCAGMVGSGTLYAY
ncbi:hypothetical protein [Ciceribacter sp. RN22]|uniref:hypothetical protein n=1 Tax=Ciceribacter sp. RN22 TaxID=2954932 RepID=UPI002091FEE6|nr:hypothetical protein [Ciceribacter sp. RN22]MCO6177315.1 hypothetical protein [Ciceribacter sp. RN22]